MARFEPNPIERIGDLLEPSPFDADGGEIIGRDPKLIPLSAFSSAGVEILRPFKAIRARCIDCCGGSPTEVRKCVSIKCPLWPMRMGKLPAHLRVKNTEDERE